MNSFETLAHKNSKKYGNDLKALSNGTGVLWRSVSTFRQACDLNVLYITGILPNSPYHMGPILSETNIVSRQIAQCNRNLMFTTSSEPCQKDRNIIDNEEYEVENASIEFWIRKHNVELLLNELKGTGSEEDRFEIEDLSEHSKFSHELGPHFANHDAVMVRFFITDNRKRTNELYEILVEISAKFTEFPSS
jgi:hypothetical protein